MIKIRDKKTNKVFTSDMTGDNSILSINFCTSSTDVEVQELMDDGSFRSFELNIYPHISKPLHKWSMTEDDFSAEFIY